jgi:hypothetical protein
MTLLWKKKKKKNTVTKSEEVKTRSKLAETSKKARAQIGPFFQLLLLL